MFVYIDLLNRLVEQYNYYSNNEAKYNAISDGNPFGPPSWIREKIYAAATVKTSMYNLLAANIDALRVRGFKLVAITRRSYVDVQYGCFGEYRRTYEYTAYLIRRIDDAESDD